MDSDNNDNLSTASLVPDPSSVDKPRPLHRAGRWALANWGLIAAATLIFIGIITPESINSVGSRIQFVIVNNPLFAFALAGLLATSQAFRYLTRGLTKFVILDKADTAEASTTLGRSGASVERSPGTLSAHDEPRTATLANMELLSERVTELEDELRGKLSDHEETLTRLHRFPAGELLSSEERAHLVQQVEAHWKTEGTNELLKQLSREVEQRRSQLSQLIHLRSETEQIRRRLLSEISQLGRRSNLNLSIGIGTTVMAISLLAYSVFTANISLDNWRDALPSQILRMSLAVFVEVFSFFFLRLYRANLDEIKYFQNEVTNVEMKLIALRSSFAVDEGSAAADVLMEIARIERNFLLKKGESTVDIARLHAESGTLRRAIASGAQILGPRSGTTA